MEFHFTPARNDPAGAGMGRQTLESPRASTRSTAPPFCNRFSPPRGKPLIG